MVENGWHHAVVTSGSSMADAEDQVMSERLCQSYMQPESAHVNTRSSCCSYTMMRINDSSLDAGFAGAFGRWWKMCDFR